MPDDQLTASECGRLVTLLIKCDRYDVITQQLDDWLDCLSLAVSESSNQVKMSSLITWVIMLSMATMIVNSNRD